MENRVSETPQQSCPNHPQHTVRDAVVRGVVAGIVRAALDRLFDLVR
jgi:hypothetical protein